MDNVHRILKQYWGYDTFRPLQEEIIATVLKGKDCLALLPTGGGKSLCFQVPALAMNGLCLVISPLIALMKDQVENLRKKNITAFAIHTGMTRKDVIHTLKIAGNSNCKFLYVSPERLETKLFREYLPSLDVSLLAIDEAHCISQWGYDFRPSYLRIASLREEIPDVPVLALTASATPVVQTDICEKLLFAEKIIFRQSFERPNLSYSVFRATSKINRIIDIVTKVQGTGIIYCKSRRRTREISDLLNMNQVKADYYHAGLMQQERNEKQESWIAGRTRIIVCTNAFGMGIDKPDVRLVVHADVPDCLENYYQEAGRAGRDGKKSYAVLLYADKELEDLKKSADSRFPKVEQIRKIYQSLMNYLQVPAGSGEGNFYAFDLADFIRKFGHDSAATVSTLKTLEQEEHVSFNEQVFVPSKVQVTGNRAMLSEFEKESPALDPMLKCLLRSYEGITDQEVNINEKMIARTMHAREEAVIGDLVKMQRIGIIRYSPQKEKPQVYFLRNRVSADDLVIDMAKYDARKKLYLERVNAMTDYAYSSTLCRSVRIGRYFGDQEIRDCGICDCCLERRKKEMTGEEFRQIHGQIIELITRGPAVMSEIIPAIRGFSGDKTKEVIAYLVAEQKVEVSGKGMISLRKGSE